MLYYDTDYSTVLSKYEFTEKNITKPGVTYQEPHQNFMRNWLSKNTLFDSILLFNELGTGKTLSSISVAEGLKEYISEMNRHIIVLVKNKNIEKNFMNELVNPGTYNEYVSDEEREIINKRVIGDPSDVNNRILKESRKEVLLKAKKKISKYYTFIPYQKFVNRVEEKSLINFNNTLVIVDEAHNITSDERYKSLYKVLSQSYNFRLMLLTATPISDNCTEITKISNLLNITELDLQLPTGNQLFKGNDPIMIHVHADNNLKGNLVKVTDSGKEKLRKSLYGKVSFIAGNTETNPKKINIGAPVTIFQGSTKVIECEMSDYQYKVYQKALNSDVNDSYYKNSSDASTIVFPKDTYSKGGFEKYSQDPEVMITNLKEYSNKLYTMLQNIKKSTGTVFIYTNWVTAGGTSLLRNLFTFYGFKELRTRNMNDSSPKFLVFDQSLNVDSRDTFRNIFNSKENKYGDICKIIIGSPVMAEGITLKNVQQVHILEPTWNMTRINQVIGRAVRNHSHDDLSLDERNVRIYKYISVYSKAVEGKNFFIDKEKYILAEEKDRNNKEIERLLKTVAIDCSLMHSRNQKMYSDEDNFQDKCDYTDCNYTCAIETGTGGPEVNKDTYDLYIKIFDEYDVESVKNFIKSLYKIFFVWDLESILSRAQVSFKNISNEAIYTALNDFVSKETQLTDLYNRTGFIINRGPYYIFNPYSINVSSSLFSKMLNFSKYQDKYSIDEYLRILNIDTDKYLKKDVEIPKEEQAKLSQEDIEYNNNIINTMHIFGTLRKRPINNVLFGDIDNKFRIVVNKGNLQDVDRRRNITGMELVSFHKKNLLEIAETLGIPLPQKITNKFLQKTIREYLISHNMVLR